MNLLFYTRDWGVTAERLQGGLQRVMARRGIEIYRSLRGLLHRLQHPPDQSFVVLLLAADQEELSSFHSLSPWLAAGRLVLVVPDQAEETLKEAHRLRPRFFTYPDGDFSELSAVIGRIAENLEEAQGGVSL
jgi:hypothetical protein